ncbi:MAG: periplasmic heavy metal sensor [Bacteroidales bacterium]|nr:periplasmic heavy metal sensor [Bacteroidales bacterium]
MKTKNPCISLLLGAALLMMTALPGIAQIDDPPFSPPPPNMEKQIPPPPPPPDRERMMHKEPRGIDLPDLTPEQRLEMRNTDLKNLKAMTSLKNQIREKHARLVTLLSSDDLDMKEVNKTIDELGVLITRMLRLHVNHDRELRDILTPDQKIIFDTKPKPFLTGHGNPGNPL